MLTVTTYFGGASGTCCMIWGLGVLPDYLTIDFPQLVAKSCRNIESVEVPVFPPTRRELRQIQAGWWLPATSCRKDRQ